MLAFALGTLGAHRFYLHGLKDKFGWLHCLATAIGYIGITLLRDNDLASVAGWICTGIGLSGLMAAFLSAIVFGLRPDEKWDAQYNPTSGQQSHSGWAVVLTVIASLMIGATVLMASFAFSFEKFFDSQIEAARKISQGE